MKKATHIDLLFCLAMVFSGGLFGCSTSGGNAKWPVFYDCEKGPEHLSILREPTSLTSFTNGIPEWNHDLCVPAAKVASATVNELGEMDGLRAVEVRLSLIDTYYSDVQMILQEVKRDQFLPVYVQDYNQGTRKPSESRILKTSTKMLIETAMDYSGTGHFHNQYKIVIAPNHNPHVIGSFY